MHTHRSAARMAAIIAAGFLTATCASTPRLDIGPSPLGVSVDARLEYYDVTAASLTEMRDAIARHGPTMNGRRFAGLTTWQLNWAYELDTRDVGGCRIRRAKVRVKTLVTMPRWNPAGEPDSAMVEWWRQLSAGLLDHERGHAILAVQAAREIVQSAEGMRAPTCAAVTAQANAAGHRHVARMTAKQEAYDRSTWHGATQIRQAGELRQR